MSEWNAETAEWYAEKYGEYATNHLAIDALELTPRRVLDVGCGTGAALRRAHARWPDAELVGVDPVPRMLEIAEARRGDARIAFKVGDASALPVEDASFDLVLAFDSFDHWQDKARGAKEIVRVLQKGGVFVVVKDQGVPALDDMSALVDAGLSQQSEVQLEGEGVRFKLWRYSA